MSTYLDRCPHPDCNELKPFHDTDCGGHGIAMCEECGERPARKQARLCNRCANAKSRAKKLSQVPEPKLQKKRAILTDAEQRRINEAVDKDLAGRCGYGHGSVKRLSKEEIAAIQNQITPVQSIPGPAIAPYWVQR